MNQRVVLATPQHTAATLSADSTPQHTAGGATLSAATLVVRGSTPQHTAKGATDGKLQAGGAVDTKATRSMDHLFTPQHVLPRTPHRECQPSLHTLSLPPAKPIGEPRGSLRAGSPLSRRLGSRGVCTLCRQFPFKVAADSCRWFTHLAGLHVAHR